MAVDLERRKRVLKWITKEIIWEARTRINLEGEPYQNENSAIHAVLVDLSQNTMDKMRENNEDNNTNPRG